MRNLSPGLPASTAAWIAPVPGETMVPVSAYWLPTISNIALRPLQRTQASRSASVVASGQLNSVEICVADRPAHDLTRPSVIFVVASEIAVAVSASAGGV